MRRPGKRPDIARRVETLAREEGPKIVSQLELLDADPANAGDFPHEQGLGMPLVLKRALLTSGLATRDELDRLADELKDAVGADDRRFSRWMLVGLIAEVRA